MIYEIRVWKKAEDMPDPEPKEAKSKLAAAASSIQGAAANPVGAALGGGGNPDNADIIINKDGAGDDVIKTVRILTELVEIGTGDFSKKIKIIKVIIKGDLYLPLVEGGATAALKAATGAGGAQPIEQQNTLRLFEWAQIQPDAKKDDAYYRGLLIQVKTKAGDFRVIRANNVYVESYAENYDEGEFGSFEIHLSQRADVTSAVTIKGITGEKLSVLEQIKGGIDKAADKAGKAAAVIGTIGVVGKVASTIGNQVISTVETFTGETEASRRAKQAMGIIGNTADVTSSTGKIVETAAKEKDKNKKAQAITQEIGNMTGKVNDSVKDGYNANTDIQKIDVTAEKVKKLEETYKEDFSKEELDVYNRMDNNGKLEMLQKKKEIATKKLENEKNQAIIDENKRRQEETEKLDRKLKEALLKKLEEGDKK